MRPPKGQETAHSEDKPHHKSRLAEDKAGSRHANTAPTKSVYKPASIGHTEIIKTEIIKMPVHPEAKRTPPRADGKPAVAHGDTKPPLQRADAKLAHGETRPPQRADAKSTPQRADAKPSKPASQHGDAKPPSALTDKARIGTVKSGTGT